jgi:hypothetical protein
MVRRQSVFLSVAICSVNVMVIVALFPDKKEGEPKPHTSDTVTMPNDELAGQTIQQPKPTLEFRRIVDDGTVRFAEFCFWNRTDEEISILAPNGYPEIHYRSNHVWFRDRPGLCGLGLTSRSIAPGKSVVIKTRAESEFIGYPPLETGTVDIREWGTKVYTADAMRIGLTYYGDSTATIWSDTIPMR